jgi:hypothetical protein
MDKSDQRAPRVQVKISKAVGCFLHLYSEELTYAFSITYLFP